VAILENGPLLYASSEMSPDETTHPSGTQGDGADRPKIDVDGIDDFMAAWSTWSFFYFGNAMGRP